MGLLASGCFLDRTGLGGSDDRDGGDGGFVDLDTGPPGPDAGRADAGPTPIDSGPTPGDDAAVPPDADVAPDAFVPTPDSGPTGCAPVGTTCASGVETVCGSDGIETTRACSLGCALSTSRCASPVPSNVASTFLASGAAARSLTTGTLDTDACTGGSVVAQSAGPDLCVLSVSTFTIAATQTVQVIGSNGLVVVAAGAVTIDGTLDASARRTVPGPGGGAGGTRSSTTGGGPSGGDRGGLTPGNQDGGGGGGGLCGAGGTGGTGQDIPGGAGGAALSASELSPLEGGSGGGWGRGTDIAPDTSATGGAGGGAIQIFSAVSITVNGTVLAAGGGANPGLRHPNPTVNYGAGGGGGSGGAILLEAPTVTFGASAFLSTTGGGGSGGASNGGDGGPGQDGRVASGRASGGASGGAAYGAAGGDSGANGTFAGLNGASNTNTFANGGGGGGGVGCILVRNTTGALPSGTGGFSPNAASALRALVVRTD